MTDAQCKDDMFIQAVRNCTGRYIEVVTGRNGYTIHKEKHAKMMAKDGMYILLEKPPEEGMKQVYDKAFILPANVVDGHFTTNDPAKIKSSFHLPGDKMRFKFHAQLYKIYEFQIPSFIVKVVPTEVSRRPFRITKEERDRLAKHNGYFLFLCVLPSGKLVDIIIKQAFMIDFPQGQSSKEIPLDLSGDGVERLNLFQIKQQESKVDQALDHPFRPESKGNPAQSTFADPPAGTPMVNQFSDNYFHRGTEIILTLPEGKEALVLKCMITGIERVVQK